MRRKKLLIFIVAYEAESTLAWVLDRIPTQILDSYDAEVLVIDDASRDGTFRVGLEYRSRSQRLPITVYRNPSNQGYGGNQKIGYAYAIENHFDAVALVHGDGQYAPEELPRLVQPVLSGEADAVFGSRFLARGGAREGGMPLYKFVGNRILSTVQNVLLGSGLSEFHSGYRVYAVEALRRVPFRLNSNDFHFDTEIIIQLLEAKATLVEKPIPTYYGKEICRVNGLRYALDVLGATLRCVLHRWGLLYQRKYDIALTNNGHYALKLGYDSAHQWAVTAVPSTASVLDLGAGPIELATLLAQKGCRVTSVDCVPPARPSPATQHITADLDRDFVFTMDGYDVLLLLDVIEHLQDPEGFLQRLRAAIGVKPRRLILSTPNVAFAIVRMMLLMGQFNYGKRGILDKSHTRLFTLRSLRRLLRDEGIEIESIRGVPAPFPAALGDGVVARALLALNSALIRVNLKLFAYQFFIIAHVNPTVENLLRLAKDSSCESPGELERASTETCRHPALARPLPQDGESACHDGVGRSSDDRA